MYRLVVTTLTLSFLITVCLYLLIIDSPADIAWRTRLVD